MAACTWTGLSFFVFAYLFFIVGTILILFDLISHILFGLKNGFFVKYDSNKSLSSSPISNIFFFGCAMCGAIYLMINATPKIVQYWQCLQ